MPMVHIRMAILQMGPLQCILTRTESICPILPRRMGMPTRHSLPPRLHVNERR